MKSTLWILVWPCLRNLNVHDRRPAAKTIGPVGRLHVLWQNFRGRDAHPLPPNHHWDRKQTEHGRQRSKNAKGLRKTSIRAPACHKEGPSEGNERSNNHDDDEAVARYCRVAFDELHGRRQHRLYTFASGLLT